MENIARRMSIFLYHKKYIIEDQIESLRFGIEVVFSNTLSFLSIITIGLVIGRVVDTIIFISVFCLSRSIRSGYHAPTFLKCYALTVGSYLTSVFLSNIISIDGYFKFSVYTIVLNVIILYLSKSYNNDSLLQVNDYFDKYFLGTHIILLLISLIYTSRELLIGIITYTFIILSSIKLNN